MTYVNPVIIQPTFISLHESSTPVHKMITFIQILFMYDILPIVSFIDV